MQTQTDTNGRDMTTHHGHNGADSGHREHDDPVYAEASDSLDRDDARDEARRDQAQDDALDDARDEARGDTAAVSADLVPAANGPSANGHEVEISGLFLRAQQYIHKVIAEAQHDATEIVAAAMAEAEDIVVAGRERARQIVQEAPAAGADNALPSETMQQLVRTIEILCRSNTELTREVTNLQANALDHQAERPATTPGVSHAQITVNQNVHTSQTWQIERPASVTQGPPITP